MLRSLSGHWLSSIAFSILIAILAESGILHHAIDHWRQKPLTAPEFSPLRDHPIAREIAVVWPVNRHSAGEVCAAVVARHYLEFLEKDTFKENRTRHRFVILLGPQDLSGDVDFDLSVTSFDEDTHVVDHELSRAVLDAFDDIVPVETALRAIDDVNQVWLRDLTLGEAEGVNLPAEALQQAHLTSLAPFFLKYKEKLILTPHGLPVKGTLVSSVSSLPQCAVWAPLVEEFSREALAQDTREFRSASAQWDRWPFRFSDALLRVSLYLRDVQSGWLAILAHHLNNTATDADTVADVLRDVFGNSMCLLPATLGGRPNSLSVAAGDDEVCLVFYDLSDVVRESSFVHLALRPWTSEGYEWRSTLRRARSLQEALHTAAERGAELNDNDGLDEVLSKAQRVRMTNAVAGSVGLGKQEGGGDSSPKAESTKEVSDVVVTAAMLHDLWHSLASRHCGRRFQLHQEDLETEQEAEEADDSVLWI